MSLLVEEDIIGGVCNFLSSLKFTWISVIKRLYKWKPWLFVLQCRVVKALDVALSNNKWNLWYSVTTRKYLYFLIALMIDNLKLNKKNVWRKLRYERNKNRNSIYISMLGKKISRRIKFWKRLLNIEIPIYLPKIRFSNYTLIHLSPSTKLYLQQKQSH